MVKDNESICNVCGKKCDDDEETVFDESSDPFCKDCYGKRIKELCEKRETIDKELWAKISLLPCSGWECTCEDKDNTIEYIHRGSHFNEIHTYCMVCGGIVGE